MLLVFLGGLCLVSGAATDECCGECSSTAVEVPENQTCAASQRAPQAPTHSLKFCHIFPDKSCCLPSQDAEIEEHYFNLLDAGDICAKESSMAKDALKKIFCASCSPLQPDYVSEDGKFRICSSLAERVKPTCFDDCGMIRVAERGNLCAGDDNIVPSKYWRSCAAGDAVQVVADDGSTAWGEECQPWDQTRDGAAGVNACCNFETQAECATLGSKTVTVDGTAEQLESLPYSCTGFYKFINDDTGAKPPFLDDFEIEIVKCDESDDVDCATKCYTGSATQLPYPQLALFLSLVIWLVLATVQ